MECGAVLEASNQHCKFVMQSRQSNSLAEDVMQGLLHPPRSLPPKYFYDERGSLLFDQICNTPEYYPTRTESQLLERYASELMQLAEPQHILEFGSGCSRKTHHLIRACEQLDVSCEYLPFDVCREMLSKVRVEYQQHYAWLDVLPLVGDYTAGLDNLHRPEGRCLYVFLGSSIGNFTQQQAQEFAAEVSACMQPGDSFLLGVDRVKPQNILRNAYNDAQGLTSEFNLNLLDVLNKELGANFHKNRFRHKAIYNEDAQRIEMYLVSQQAQSVDINLLNETIELQKHDEILTEVSHKYTYTQIEALLNSAGLVVSRHIEADNAWFSLVLAHKPL